MPYLDARLEGNALWIRDFQTQIQPNETQRNTLIVAGVYVIIIAILWCVFLTGPCMQKLRCVSLKACSLFEGHQWVWFLLF